MPARSGWARPDLRWARSSSSRSSSGERRSIWWMVPPTLRRISVTAGTGMPFASRTESVGTMSARTLRSSRNLTPSLPFHCGRWVTGSTGSWMLAVTRFAQSWRGARSPALGAVEVVPRVVSTTGVALTPRPESVALPARSGAIGAAARRRATRPVAQTAEARRVSMDQVSARRSFARAVSENHCSGRRRHLRRPDEQSVRKLHAP